MSKKPYSWMMTQDENGNVCITLFDETGEEAVVHKCSPANGLVIETLKEQVAQLRTDNASLLKALKEAVEKI